MDVNSTGSKEAQDLHPASAGQKQRGHPRAQRISGAVSVLQEDLEPPPPISPPFFN